MTGATKWFYKAQNGTVLETIAIGYADRPTAGATSSVTIAYPNTQSSNGWAVQIGIPAIPQQMGLLGSIWTGTVEAPIHATKWNGTTESAVSSFDLYTGDYRISDLLSTSPFYIAHRGGGDNWPEHTFRSYSSAVNYGMKAIEVSTHITSDGVIICHHDPSTLRMTGTDLTIASSTKAQLDALTNTAAFTDNPSQNREPIPTLVSVLNAYAGNHVIFVEPKALGNSWRVNTLLPLLNSYANSTQRIIWKSYINAPEFANAKAAGYTTWGYILTADPAHTNNLGTLIPNPNIDLIGVQTSASDAFVTDVVSRANAVGKKVIMWEIHTIAERDRAVALGCVGMMTSNLWVVLPKFP
jgi:glycerophosphoryl diester phosphodiesterase